MAMITIEHQQEIAIAYRKSKRTATENYCLNGNEDKTASVTCYNMKR